MVGVGLCPLPKVGAQIFIYFSPYKCPRLYVNDPSIIMGLCASSTYLLGALYYCYNIVINDPSWVGGTPISLVPVLLHFFYFCG